jgi:endonuclease/exonuclease/phosphatase family metal-dependent hydrolase
MRLATYNVEWFSALFGPGDTLLRDDAGSGRHNVTRRAQADALATVFRALDADAVLVVEAPDQGSTSNTVAALKAFAGFAGLRTTEVVMGFANETQQELALLYDPAVLTARHAPQDSPEAPRFDDVFQIDLDVDATRDKVRFSKPPLELEVLTRSGVGLRMIGVHLKSKWPHGASTRDQAMRLAIANRRKQLAQAIWLRRRVEEVLAAGQALIVLGDLNDGPGLDAYEALFGHSSVEVVMGPQDGTGGQLFDPHALRATQARPGAITPTSARFWIRDEKRYLQALLDYIFVSEDLRARHPVWRIWHPLDDPECWANPDLREALVTASDHFPVTLDIAL